MKTEGNWWTAVLSAGITAGYATTVVQLSPGPRLRVLSTPSQADRKDREPAQLAPHVGQGLRGESRQTRLLRLVSQPVGVAPGMGYGSQDKPGTVRSQVGGRVDCGRWHGRVPPPLG